MVQGGFPLALTAVTPASRGRWMSNFVRLTLERDVQELSRIRQARALPALLQRIAGQTSQVLNNNHLAEGLGLDEKTARDYIRLLEPFSWSAPSPFGTAQSPNAQQPAPRFSS